MPLKDDLELRVSEVLAQRWSLRDGEVVPETDDVTLENGLVRFEATILYADLADSTELVTYNPGIAGRIFKAYLDCSTRLIRDHDGDVRSFDGDRVMGIFIGDYKNTSATKCALKINYAFRNIIVPQLKAKYEACRNGTVRLAQCVGVDTSKVFAIRSGIRNNNDLVWVGRAANIAAKLSSIREPGYSTYISEDVFSKMNDEAKFGGNPRMLMWEGRSWGEGKKFGVETVYRSCWWWKP